MSWFSNLKIGKKLALGFAAVEVLMVALGVFSILQLSKLNADTVDIATKWMPSVRTLDQLRFDASGLRRDSLNYVVATEKKAHYLEKLSRSSEAVAEDQIQYEPMISSDEERRLYQEFVEAWDKYLVVNNRVREL